MIESGSKRTGRRHGRSVMLLALPLTLALLGGCGKKPGGQVVAVVNNEEITQQELQAEAQALQVPASADRHAATVALLKRVIDRNLLASYAREQGLDRGPEYVAQRRRLEQTLLAELALRKLAGPQTDPTPADIQAFIQSHPTLFAQREKLALNQVVFPTLADHKTLEMLTKLPTMESVASQLKADGIGYTPGTPVVDTGSLDPSVARQITALRNGQVFDISTGGQTFISAITARSPAATAPNTWAPIAANAMKQERLTKSVDSALAKLRKDATIQYDPAFNPKAR